MDTKKKETLDNFYREGVTDAIEPTIVNDHDFPSQGNGKVIQHEISRWKIENEYFLFRSPVPAAKQPQKQTSDYLYDLGKNKAVVYLACKGVPLESIETAKHYMEKTETTTGLKVVVKIIDKVFEKGRQYAADFKEKMSIQFDKLLPKWNYIAVPDGK